MPLVDTYYQPSLVFLTALSLRLVSGSRLDVQVWVGRSHLEMFLYLRPYAQVRHRGPPCGIHNVSGPFTKSGSYTKTMQLVVAGVLHLGEIAICMMHLSLLLIALYRMFVLPRKPPAFYKPPFLSFCSIYFF